MRSNTPDGNGQNLKSVAATNVIANLPGAKPMEWDRENGSPTLH